MVIAQCQDHKFGKELYMNQDAWHLLGIKDDPNTPFVLQSLIAIGIKILNADEGALLIADKENNNLKFAMVVGEKQNLIGSTVPMGVGITGMAALTRDIQTASSFDENVFYRVKNDGSPHSVLAAPLLYDDELLGVITAVSFNLQKEFSIDECQNYGNFANIAATILYQQQLLNSISADLEKRVFSERQKKEYQAIENLMSLIKQNPDKIDLLIEILSLLNKF